MDDSSCVQTVIPLFFFIYVYLNTTGRSCLKIKMRKVVKDTHFFINTELGHHLPVIQLVSILE
jgi:hypothetical protein